MKLAPLDTWPDLRVTVHLPPWCWRIRPRFYADDHPWAHVSAQWLCFDVEWWAQDEPSRWFLDRTVAPEHQWCDWCDRPGHNLRSGCPEWG